MENKEETSALDSLEHKLYDPKEKLEVVSPHHVRDRREKELPTSWGDNTAIMRPADDHVGMSFGAKFLIVASLILLIVLAFTAWRVLSARNIVSEKNIDITLDVTPYVEGGETTPLVVSLLNRNDVDLIEASITLMYKRGTGAQEEEDKIQTKRELTTVGSGVVRREDFEVTLYGSEGESRDVSLKLEYKVKGSNALFSKTVVTQVVLKSPPMSVRIEGPTTLSVGQSGVFSIVVSNNTGTTTESTLLTATLPANFTLEESSVKPSARGTAWQINPLAPGEEAEVRITGTFSGSEGEVSAMRALIGSLGGSLNEIGVVYSSDTHDIRLRTSPLVMSYTFDTERIGGSESLMYGDRIILTVRYRNASQTTLLSPKIKLVLGGTAALLKDVKVSDGYYDSTIATITWDSASVEGFTSIPANHESTFQVIIPVVTKGSNSPKLVLTLTGTATSQETDDVVSTVTKTYVVQGSASVSASTKYRNAPFVNTGPIPPQANVDTTYDVRVSVSAQNALQNAKVSFVLPAYVAWRSVSSDPVKVLYDAKTRTVSWNIGSVDAGKTVAADIGLSVRPSQVHVGKIPAITGGIVLDADEVESRVHIKTTVSAATTYIEGESWPSNPSVVVDP